jgi:hypothetical protein
MRARGLIVSFFFGLLTYHVFSGREKRVTVTAPPNAGKRNENENEISSTVVTEGKKENKKKKKGQESSHCDILFFAVTYGPNHDLALEADKTWGRRVNHGQGVPWYSTKADDRFKNLTVLVPKVCTVLYLRQAGFGWLLYQERLFTIF